MHVESWHELTRFETVDFVNFFFFDVVRRVSVATVLLYCDRFMFDDRRFIENECALLLTIKDALHLHSQPKVQHNKNFTTSQHDKNLKKIKRIEDIKDFNFV